MVGETCTSDMPPTVTGDTSSLTFAWADWRLMVDAERWNSEGQVELAFRQYDEDKEKLLVQSKVNLLSISNIAALVKRLERSYKDTGRLPWDWILTCITREVLKTARQGEPVQEIQPVETSILAPTYLLQPLLPEKHPTVIFGDYGSGKSLFALVVAYSVQSPPQQDDLGLIPQKQPCNCLYLDWEDDQSSFEKRWSGISRGFSAEPSIPILYRRMTNTLCDDVEELKKIITDKHIGLLLVDSLGAAARGNLNDPEPAIKYHEALRKLGITSLTVAHCSKDQQVRKRTIYGSVFFTNLARCVWEVKAKQEVGEDELSIELKNHKANLSKLHPPLGYRFSFTDNTITVCKTDLQDTRPSAEVPLRFQIGRVLQQGPLPTTEIADQLSGKPETIERTLRRMRERNEAMRLEDGTWGSVPA